MFRELQGEHILILAGDHMYRMDYRQLLLDHTQQGADITIGALPCSQEDIAGFGALRLDDIGRVVEFREKPATPREQEGMAVPSAMLKLRGMTADRPFLASMGIYMFRKDCLDEALDNNLVDFGRDIIPAALSRYRVHAHFFDGYWRDIGTIRSFFQAHMDLVKPEPPFTFHDPSWVFYTRPRYLPGARLHNCCFDRVLLADGTRVQDSDIKEGVLGLRTNITGARLRRALIMGRDTHYPSGPPGCPPVGIGEGTEIRDAIIDKNARIGKNVRILNEKGVQEADGDAWAIRDGIVVVPKNSVIPNGTVI
jgi:glucose-1-phosphate adenylyltransferase